MTNFSGPLSTHNTHLVIRMKNDGKKKQSGPTNNDSMPKHQPADNYKQRRNMAYIQRRMKAGDLPPPDKLATILEVSERTIFRYLKQMRTEQDKNATFNKKGESFGYEGDVAFSDISVTEKEMIAMTVAKKDLAHRNVAGLDKSITSALKKIVKNASTKVVKRIKDWERIISFRMSGETITDPHTFDTLVKSAGYQKKLWIDYKDPEGKATTRTIDPLHLSCVNGDWYLFAFDYLRNKVRTFCPCRIKTLEVKTETFEWPEGWEVEKHLATSFGIFEGKPGKEYQTVIRFKECIADFIREKKWKGQTAIVELPGGGVELHQTLNGLFELQLWVMKWGKSAKVMSPPELRDMVLNEARAMVCVYETEEWKA
jgi:predicted DNA-binding transcriptional regulator YafY